MTWLPKWLLYFAGVCGMAGMAIRIVQRRVGQILAKRKEAE